MKETIKPITRHALQNLPLGADSPCELTPLERTVIVFYMSVETLEDIAFCEPFTFVATWQRRAGQWIVPQGVTLAKIDRFRFGPIAHAVIDHAKNELARLAKLNPSTN